MSKYDKLVAPKLEHIAGWKRGGVSDERIAKNLGIAYSTFRKYRSEHKELAEVLETSAEEANIQVEGAVFKRALGYTVRVKKTFKLKKTEYDPETGRKVAEYEELKTGEDEVHIPADVRAQQFWLANRSRERWKIDPSKVTPEESGENGVIELAMAMEQPEAPEGEPDGA